VHPCLMTLLLLLLLLVLLVLQVPAAACWLATA
jgi:hypothetical protein